MEKISQRQAFKRPISDSEPSVFAYSCCSCENYYCYFTIKHRSAVDFSVLAPIAVAAIDAAAMMLI